MGMLLHRHLTGQAKPAPEVAKPEVKAEPKPAEPKTKKK